MSRGRSTQLERQYRYEELVNVISIMVDVEIKKMESSKIETIHAHKCVLELLKSSCETSLHALSAVNKGDY